MYVNAHNIHTNIYVGWIIGKGDLALDAGSKRVGGGAKPLVGIPRYSIIQYFLMNSFYGLRQS